jgi:hypothetical protein
MTTMFCDGIRSVSLRSGVLRVELSRTAPDGEPQAAGQLLLPEDEAHAFLNTLQRRVEELTGPRDPEAERPIGPADPTDIDEDIGDLT